MTNSGDSVKIVKCVNGDHNGKVGVFEYKDVDMNIVKIDDNTVCYAYDVAPIWQLGEVVPEMGEPPVGSVVEDGEGDRWTHAERDFFPWIIPGHESNSSWENLSRVWPPLTLVSLPDAQPEEPKPLDMPASTARSHLRVYELANTLGMEVRDLVNALHQLGVPVWTASSRIEIAYTPRIPDDPTIDILSVLKTQENDMTTLELTEDEKLTLKAILCRVGGDPKLSARKHADSVLSKLGYHLSDGSELTPHGQIDFDNYPKMTSADVCRKNGWGVSTELESGPTRIRITGIVTELVLAYRLEVGNSEEFIVDLTDGTWAKA